MEFIYLIAIIMISLSVILRLREKNYNKNMQEVIDNHNTIALFIYNDEKSLNEAWIKDESFLLSTNGGKHPSEFSGEIVMFDYKSVYCLADIQER